MAAQVARDKMKGKSEGKGESGAPSSATQLQDRLAAREAKSTSHECGERDHWADDPRCPGTRGTNCTTWSDEHWLPDREDFRAMMMVGRVGQFEHFSSCSGLREHSVCTASVTDPQQILAITYLSCLTLFLPCSPVKVKRLVDL